MAENYRPRVGDSVWVEGFNPEAYRAMKFWDPVNWGQEYSQPNAIVISVDRDGAMVDHYSGYGSEFYTQDCFNMKHYNPGCVHGHWLIRF